jgi:hypothetical protein
MGGRSSAGGQGEARASAAPAPTALPAGRAGARALLLALALLLLASALVPLTVGRGEEARPALIAACRTGNGAGQAARSPAR